MKPKAAPVKILTVEKRDVPVSYEFVGQAESSRQVEIRARVNGFLDKIAYEEGQLVEPDQILFQIDQKPFQAALQQAQGEVAAQKARYTTAEANLKRIRPLAEKDAVSQKDLDDAVGMRDATKAAVLSALGSLREAQLNLGYTTIRSPLKGLASRAIQREGSYISTGPEGLLTYVAQLDPVWVNFSISENQILRIDQEEKQGLITLPKDKNYVVEAILSDGSLFPHKGRISFAEPNVDPKTGTFLIRAELSNPEGRMRPGQFVNVRLLGAVRNNAILVPQSAVSQGSKGHFVWVVDEKGEAQVRAVMVGPWYEDSWFITGGLNPGDRVILEGTTRLRPEMPVEVVQ